MHLLKCRSHVNKKTDPPRAAYTRINKPNLDSLRLSGDGHIALASEAFIDLISLVKCVKHCVHRFLRTSATGCHM
jgi:hypothetical protein